jgi:ribosomal-protein-alanine N-acetyltransferase
MLDWFAPDPLPELTTARLTLRGPRAADYPHWRDIRYQSRKFLRPFEPRWTDADLAASVYRARLGKLRQEARDGSDYTYFVFLDTEPDRPLVGGITLSNVRRRAAQMVNLGYWMGEPYAGLGIMSEAVSAIVPFCFETLGLHRIQAAFVPGNMASRRVLEKNGFYEEGFAENYLQIDGRWADHVLFALTRERYEKSRAPKHP